MGLGRWETFVAAEISAESRARLGCAGPGSRPTERPAEWAPSNTEQTTRTSATKDAPRPRLRARDERSRRAWRIGFSIM